MQHLSSSHRHPCVSVRPRIVSLLGAEEHHRDRVDRPVRESPCSRGRPHYTLDMLSRVLRVRRSWESGILSPSSGYRPCPHRYRRSFHRWCDAQGRAQRYRQALEGDGRKASSLRPLLATIWSKKHVVPGLPGRIGMSV